MESAPVAENTLPLLFLCLALHLIRVLILRVQVLSLEGELVCGLQRPQNHCLLPDMTLPPLTLSLLPTLLTVFPSPLSILPQAALEEIHRFSGTYTCMNTFKGRT